MTDKLIGLEEVAREWMRHQHDLPTWLDASNGQRRIARRRAADLIRTLDAARKAKGWVPAPEVPTYEMSGFGDGAIEQSANGQGVYLAMLAAAPAPTEDG